MLSADSTDSTTNDFAAFAALDYPAAYRVITAVFTFTHHDRALGFAFDLLAQSR